MRVTWRARSAGLLRCATLRETSRESENGTMKRAAAMMLGELIAYLLLLQCRLMRPGESQRVADSLILALCLLIGAYALGELAVRMLS